MPEYTYEDIIINPEDPRIELGKEYYINDAPSILLDEARKDFDARILKAVYKDQESPFVTDLGYSYYCIIRKKEPSYAERQEKWIAENHIKEDDEVQIIRKADSEEDGWGSFWNQEMDDAVGKVGRVYFCTKVHGIEVDVPNIGLFFYPYFILKKVEQKYVPFDLSDKEVRDKLRGAWVKANKDSDKEQNVCGVCSEYVYLSCQTQGCTAEDFLKGFTFLDGTPCGKLEVAEND